MPRLRLPLVVCACVLFWTILGLLAGALFHHGRVGLVGGLIFGLAYVLLGLTSTDYFAVAAWNAKLLENSQAPKLYEMLQEICERADMDVPLLFSYTHKEPNAFVVSRRDGDPVLAVSSSLTRVLAREEVAATLALMVARLATGSMATWNGAATLAGMPLLAGMRLRNRPLWGWLGTGLLTVFAAPAASLVRLGWDERLWVAADGHAAHLAESPAALESALRKIEAERTEAGGLSGNPATEILFAVPPLPEPLPDAPFWRQMLARLPGRRPEATGRAKRFQETFQETFSAAASLEPSAPSNPTVSLKPGEEEAYTEYE